MEGISDSYVKDILKSQGNVICENNEAVPITCPATTNGYTNKCSDIYETVVIKGVKGYDDSKYRQIIHWNIMKDALQFIKICSDRLHYYNMFRQLVLLLHTQTIAESNQASRG